MREKLNTMLDCWVNLDNVRIKCEVAKKLSRP